MLEIRPDSVADQPEFHSLVELLHKRAEETPDQLAYQFLVDGQHEGPHLSYAELDRQAQAIAARL